MQRDRRLSGWGSPIPAVLVYEDPALGLRIDFILRWAAAASSTRPRRQYGRGASGDVWDFYSGRCAGADASVGRRGDTAAGSETSISNVITREEDHLSAPATADHPSGFAIMNGAHLYAARIPDRLRRRRHLGSRDGAVFTITDHGNDRPAMQAVLLSMIANVRGAAAA